METVDNTAQVMVPEAQRGTAARSMVYRALSALFFYPQEGTTTPELLAGLHAWQD